MNEVNIYTKGFSIFVELPINQPKGKVRLKSKSNYGDIGIPEKMENIDRPNVYFEWQISYGNTDNLIELSLIFKKAFEINLIAEDEISALCEKINTNTCFINKRDKPIRSKVTYECIDGIYFEKFLTYPVLIHRFNNSEVFVEILVEKNQKATGIQPMLYLYIPINYTTVIKDDKKRILEINKANINIFIKMFEIFGILSQSHKHDTIEILNTILR